MIHGLFRRNSPDALGLEPSVLDGSHSSLNIDSTRKKIITWSNSRCWMAQSIEKPTDTALSQPAIERIGATRIVAWASLYHRKELANKLAIDKDTLTTLSDGLLILMAYLQFGEDCLKHLSGDFCFAIYNEETQHFFCARDPMGVRPFFYYMNEQCFIFSSSLSLFHTLDEINIRPDMGWAAKFLLANMSMDFHKTAYHNIFKLKPAHFLCIKEKSHTQQQYFVFHLNKIQLNSSQDYVEMYAEQLDEAIKCRVQTPHLLGSELSGGIDSSTVTAFAAKHYPGGGDNLYTFSFAAMKDEPHYVLQVNQQYKISNAFICCNMPQNNYDKEKTLKIIGAPVEHANALSHELFYDMAAKHNIRTLLSGFGGDEFVTSIHADLYLYELLNNNQYLKLYQTLKGNAFIRALRLCKLLLHTDKRGGKINPQMRKTFDSRWADVVICPELIHAYAIKESYDAKANFDNGYSDLDTFTLENRLQPFVSTRMENCSLMAASYGIEYRWPLLDPKLIQTFLSIPSSEKFHKGMGRYLHRKAISGTVPNDIVWKEGKFMGERAKEKTLREIRVDTILHQDLLPVIDLIKLKEQESQLAGIKTWSPQINQKIQNIRQVNALNHWLTYYFPKGCNWV